jgi:hypothetical protein
MIRCSTRPVEDWSSEDHSIRSACPQIKMKENPAFRSLDELENLLFAPHPPTIPEIRFASCEVLSPQTPIQLRHEAGSEDEQRAIVHELITGALAVLLGQVGLRAHRFHDQWIEYSESQEDDAATVSSMEDGNDDSLMEHRDYNSLDELENLLFGTPDDNDGDQGVRDFEDINPPPPPEAVAEGLGGLFSLGANLAIQAIPGNVAWCSLRSPLELHLRRRRQRRGRC